MVAGRLKAAGVPTAIYNPKPLHFQPAYAVAGGGPGSLLASERLPDEIPNLPMNPHLGDAEITYICDSFRRQSCPEAVSAAVASTHLASGMSSFPVAAQSFYEQALPASWTPARSELGLMWLHCLGRICSIAAFDLEMLRNSRRKAILVLRFFAGGSVQRDSIMIANQLDPEYSEPHIIVLEYSGPWVTLLRKDIPVTCLFRACVAMPGFDPVPAPWVAGADALVLPSRWEGQANTALEALA